MPGAGSDPRTPLSKGVSLTRFTLFPTEGQIYEHPRSLKYQSEPPPDTLGGGFVVPSGRVGPNRLLRHRCDTLDLDARSEVLKDAACLCGSVAVDGVWTDFWRSATA